MDANHSHNRHHGNALSSSMLSSPMIYPTSSSQNPSSIQDFLATPDQRRSSTIGQTPPLSNDLYSLLNMDNPHRSSSLGNIPIAMTQRRQDLGTEHERGVSTIDGTNQNQHIRVIWGTTIVVKEAMESFRDFLLYFAKPNDPNHPLYPKLLLHLKNTESNVLNLDTENLRSYQRTILLYRHLVAHPQEIIPIMDITISQVFLELFPDTDPSTLSLNPIQTRPYNLDRIVNMRELSPSEVDQLIVIKGLVIRSSPILPDMRIAYFKCSSCNSSTTIESFKGKIQEPSTCSHCHTKCTMTLIHNRCQYSDKQLVKVQETPDSVPDGQTPHAVTICVYDTLVDAVRPGDRIELTGLFRVSHIRLNSRQRRVKNIFRTYIDAVHMKRTDVNRMQIDDPNDTNEQIQDESMYQSQIISMSNTPDLYEKLSRSVAPSIFQLDVVKKSLLLQLFGGVSKTFQKYGNTKFRGDINVLLTGDPSVSKSQLLQYVHKLVPRGIYTSGKGSSAVGLTAYITRDPESGQLVLESGALVLSDGGLCCIDEFDKMPDTTRSILHEVMEQQTVSVAKAGIITTLNARASILAAANPVDSKYNPNKSIIDNIHLPPSLLSRFDIICLILDRPDEAHDIQLARHITLLHVTPGLIDQVEDRGYFDVQSLARYISYARKHVHPILSDDAIRALLEGYVSMRRVNQGSGNHGEKTISATTRQLESLIRLSEAHAKMRLSDNVEIQDVTEAIRLVKSAILSYALDPVTGKVDMDLITTGKSASFREQVEDLKKHIKEHLQARGPLPLDMAILSKEMNEQASIQIGEKLFREAIMGLAEEEVIHVHGPFKANSVIRRII